MNLRAHPIGPGEELHISTECLVCSIAQLPEARCETVCQLVLFLPTDWRIQLRRLLYLIAILCLCLPTVLFAQDHSTTDELYQQIGRALAGNSAAVDSPAMQQLISKLVVATDDTLPDQVANPRNKLEIKAGGSAQLYWEAVPTPVHLGGSMTFDGFRVLDALRNGSLKERFSKLASASSSSALSLELKNSDQSIVKVSIETNPSERKLGINVETGEARILPNGTKVQGSISMEFKYANDYHYLAAMGLTSRTLPLEGAASWLTQAVIANGTPAQGPPGARSPSPENTMDVVGIAWDEAIRTIQPALMRDQMDYESVTLTKSLSLVVPKKIGGGKLLPENFDVKVFYKDSERLTPATTGPPKSTKFWDLGLELTGKADVTKFAGNVSVSIAHTTDPDVGRPSAAQLEVAQALRAGTPIMQVVEKQASASVDASKVQDSALLIAVSQALPSQLGSTEPVVPPSLQKALQNWTNGESCHGADACTRFERDDHGDLLMVEHSRDGTTRAWHNSNRGIEMAQKTAAGTSAFLLPPETAVNALERAPKVGGVRLGFVLDVLAALDSKTANVQSSATTITGNFKLFSLNALVRELQRTNGDFDRLPEEARELGHISRIHGFVLEPSTQDVMLLGLSEPQEPSIPAKDLVTGLRAVYGEQLEPAVSLDPIPMQPFGPQVARVLGVPSDSHFARTMLDADYQMKKIMQGTDLVEVPGFRSTYSLLTSAPEVPQNFNSRFWFAPVQPSAAEFHLSSSSDQALFSATIQVLTEAGRETQAGFLGTGVSDPLAEEAARSFTTRYSEIETQFPIFRQLHGLADVVLASTVLRYTGASVPVLTELSRFVPAGERNMRTRYPAIESRVNADFQLVGGVILAQRASHRVFVSYIDNQMQQLRVAAFRLASSHEMSAPLGLNSIVIASPTWQQDAIQQALDRGQLLLKRGKYLEAVGVFNTALSQNNAVAELYAFRAVAHTGAKQFSEALADAATARQLEPAEGEFAQIQAYVGMQAGTNIDWDSVSLATRKALAAEMFLIATHDLQTGKPDQAAAKCDFGIRLDPDNAVGYLTRAMVRESSEDYRGAIEDYDQAIRLKQDFADALFLRGNAHARKSDYDQAIHDYDDVLRLNFSDADALNNRGNAYRGKGDYDRAIQDYDQAIRLKPEDAVPFYDRGIIYEAKGDWKRAIQDYDQAILLKADFADAYLGKAAALLDGANEMHEKINGRPETSPSVQLGKVVIDVGIDEATAACKKAIEINPQFGEAYLVRATLRTYNTLKTTKEEWKAAVKDYDIAIELCERQENKTCAEKAKADREATKAMAEAP